MKSSQNILISMLEDLLSQTDIEQKKRILTEEYGMIMTTELEGRIQTMCNWSENIRDTAMKEGIEKERLNAQDNGIILGQLTAIQKSIQLLMGYIRQGIQLSL